MTDRQHNIIVKAKKDCNFNYLLSYKSVSKGDKKKIYIKTFKYLIYIYKLYLNSFLFKVYEKNIIEYQALID